MSKKKEPEFEENINTEEVFQNFDKLLDDFATSLVWTDAKEIFANAFFSTLTKYVTDVAVAQYLSEYQKLAIKAYRDKVLTLVDYYLHHPNGEEIKPMLEACKKSFQQLVITCTGDLENENKYVAEGELRPTVVLSRAIDEAKHWAHMYSDDYAREILATISLDHNNICGFYSKKIEDLSEMAYNNAKVYVSEPTVEEWTTKGEETLDYYLDRPEVDDSEKLKLQETPNFKLPLEDVKKKYKNFGAYKTRLNNLFKKAFKDGVEMTDEDFKGILQYLEEHLWYSAKVFSEGEEITGDSVEGWLMALSIAEAVYVSMVKAIGNEKFWKYYNSNEEFRISFKETLLNAIYLLCFYLTQFEDYLIYERIFKFTDQMTDEFGPDINNEFKLGDFFYFLEDIHSFGF